MNFPTHLCICVRFQLVKFNYVEFNLPHSFITTNLVNKAKKMGNLEICLQKIKDLPCQYDADLEDMSRLATFRRGFQLFLSRTVCLLIELVFGSAVFYSLCLLYITLLRFSGWERAPRFLSDSSPGISTP